MKTHYIYIIHNNRNVYKNNKKVSFIQIQLPKLYIHAYNYNHQYIRILIYIQINQTEN